MTSTVTRRVLALLAIAAATTTLGCAQDTAPIPSGPVVFANEKAATARALAPTPIPEDDATDTTADSTSSSLPAATPDQQAASTTDPEPTRTIDSAVDAPAANPVDQTTPSQTLDCVDFSQTRLQLARQSRELAEVADEFPALVWLCANTDLTHAALECFEEQTEELLETVDTVTSPNATKDLRNSNAVLCRAGDPTKLDG